jgi:transposase InsO family protein
MRRREEDQRLLELICPIKAEQPGWGYRMTWAYLKYRQGHPVNRKRVYRIMRENDLLVKPNTRLKATRDNQDNRNKPRATRPNQFWGIDMTKVMIETFGWLYLVVVLDWYTKKIIGYSVGTRSRAVEWLDAVNMACNQQFPKGILRKDQELCLVSDNGSQPTALAFMKACSVMEIKQIFASYNNPKGNADTERVIKTIKHDFVWVNEFDSPLRFTEGLAHWVEKYNTDRPHSTLGYKTPCDFEKEQLQLATKNIVA